MVGGNDLPHRDVIQREISRVLVLNLSGEKRGARHLKGRVTFPRSALNCVSMSM